MNGHDQRLDEIAKMLRAQLKGAGHLWWVAGYVYGQTSNGDVFVILYPAAENLKEKVVRVYDHDLKKLPAFIPTEGIDGGDTEANPSKEQARKKGIYHECPAFEIVTFDGKDTQMGKERRFGDVLRLSRKAAEAVAQVGGRVGAQTPAAAAQGQQRPTQQPHTAGQEQRPPAQQQLRPAAPPQPEEPPDEVGRMELPDYRKLALEAETDAAFDYAAYMVLRNGLYTDQERVKVVRQALVPAWKPSPQSNGAMLHALEVYRDKRAAAEGRGEASTAASAFAKKEAMNAYNKAMN